jgi:SAM-dependent methyltransferase
MTSRQVPTAARAIADEADRIRHVYAGRPLPDRYGWDQPGQAFMLLQLERELLRALVRHGRLPLGGQRILELGCGSGHFLRELVKWGANPDQLVGIDLLHDRLQEARTRLPGGVRLEPRNAADTGYPDDSFDLLLQMTLFTSVLSAELRERMADEMCRILAPGGMIIWYDFRVNNPSNPDVRGIGAREIRGLFPGAIVSLKSTTLAPPLARRLAPRAWWMCSALSAIPLLRTHYLATIRPSAS